MGYSATLAGNKAGTKFGDKFCGVMFFF